MTTHVDHIVRFSIADLVEKNRAAIAAGTLLAASRLKDVRASYALRRNGKCYVCAIGALMSPDVQTFVSRRKELNVETDVLFLMPSVIDDDYDLPVVLRGEGDKTLTRSVASATQWLHDQWLDNRDATKKSTLSASNWEFPFDTPLRDWSTKNAGKPIDKDLFVSWLDWLEETFVKKAAA